MVVLVRHLGQQIVLCMLVHLPLLINWLFQLLQDLYSARAPAVHRIGEPPSQLIGNLGVFKLATGSYAGTGTSGEASPTKITFPGTPLVWGIPGSQYASIPGGFEYTSDQPIIVGKVTRINYHIGNTTRTCNVSWSGNTASLWATEPFTQMNDADYIYFWYCIYK